jgi:gamma-glutamyl-gamma-aminobutyrate hydrolase PuuD
VDDPWLRGLLGATLTVSVPHHDPRFPPLPGFRVAARGPAGSIDALVGVDRPVLAVQWHPESLPPGDPAREAPFRWLRQQVGRA